VRIPALGIGVMTKDNGVYTMLVPAARVEGQQVTLLARLVGYRARTDTISLTSGIITHDFTLAMNPLQLGEIVVTGAGMVTEAKKLGSVRNAVDSSQIQRSSEMNVVEALAGKAPNVDVVGSAGDPGASSFIRIRGLNTIWKGERVTLPRDLVATLTERRLAVGRSAAFAAGTVAFAVVVAQGIRRTLGRVSQYNAATHGSVAGGGDPRLVRFQGVCAGCSAHDATSSFRWDRSASGLRRICPFR